MKALTLKDLDAEKKRAEAASAKAWARYQRMHSEYIKNCPHERITSRYDDWDKRYTDKCGVCGEVLGISK